MRKPHERKASRLTLRDLVLTRLSRATLFMCCSNLISAGFQRDALKTLPQLGIMMTFAEVEFIQAELSLKGYTTEKTTKQHYELGVAASITQWGATIPTDFLQRPGVSFDEAASMEVQFEQIMLQKYYAYFFVDYQSWFEKRRTGYPILPRGTGIPAENNFPYRIPYPTYLQSLNSENLTAAVRAMGGDNSDVKVWWDQ